MAIIHDTIKSFREDRGLTHQQMADKLCITRSAYSKFESGTRKIDDMKRLEQVAKIFGTNLNDLIKFSENKKQDKNAAKIESENLLSSVFEKIDIFLFSTLHYHSTKYEIPVPFEELSEYDLDYLSICGLERTSITKEIYEESFWGITMKFKEDGHYLAFKEMMTNAATYDLARIFFNSSFGKDCSLIDEWERLQKEIESVTS